MKIVDPILFAKNFVPMEYLRPGAEVFDFADMDNPAGEQLFNEVVGSLSAAFSNYTNDPSRGNRISRIQGDQIGFAQSLSQAVEEGYTWKSGRGLEIVKVAITAIEYDEDTKKLLSDVKRQMLYQEQEEIHLCNNQLLVVSKQLEKMVEELEWHLWEWA